MIGISSTTFQYRCKRIKAVLAEKLQENVQDEGTATAMNNNIIKLLNLEDDYIIFATRKNPTITSPRNKNH